MSEVLTGLTSNQVKNKISLGLSNSVIDTYSPSLSQIFLRNIFSVINIIVFPLLIFLAYFQLYMEVVAFGFFLLINTATSLFDEIRIKLEVDRLRKQFEIKATVIRDEEKKQIPVDEIVADDLCFAKEGDQIVADGKIIRSAYLQLDESVITGESDYIQKNNGDQVFSSTFVVTGECYYQVTSVGNNNYTNKLVTATTKFQKVKSPLQKNADKLISILIFLAIFLGIINFLTTASQSNLTIQARILSVTAITALIIPQTLIFLFTLTFSISISRLFAKGVLVQRGASIENLSNTDIICLDKTGTITTNQMKLANTIPYGVDEFELGRFYASCQEQLFGITKTQSLLNERYADHKKINIREFDQKPFTSKDKYSYFTGIYKGEYNMLLLGAYEKLINLIPVNKQREITAKIEEMENQGKRLLLGIHLYSKNKLEDPFTKFDDKSYVGSILYIIDEELNLGIIDIIKKLNEQGIKIKIISGDSYNSVKTIASKVGLNTQKIADLSKKDLDLQQLSQSIDIFTRATPDDKLQLISIFKQDGNTVAMIGDGVNDVLSMKAADVSIAMENGASVTRSTADMVLINNDYSKLPEIFHEGENIIFNLNLSTKLFLAKSLFAILTALAFIFTQTIFPIHPSSTLIFSFYGASLPSYILIFSRNKLPKQGKRFFTSVFTSAIPAAIIMSLFTIVLHYSILPYNLGERAGNTIQAMQLLIGSMIYALFVIYRSKKLTSIPQLFIWFCLGFYLGFIQTLLPLNINAPFYQSLITMILIAIGSLAIIVLGFKYFVKRSFKKGSLIFFLALLWAVILAIFPFRDYYHIETLSSEGILIVSIMSIMYLTFFSLELLFWRVLFHKR